MIHLNPLKSHCKKFLKYWLILTISNINIKNKKGVIGDFLFKWLWVYNLISSQGINWIIKI